MVNVVIGFAEVHFHPNIHAFCQPIGNGVDYTCLFGATGGRPAASAESQSRSRMLATPIGLDSFSSFFGMPTTRQGKRSKASSLSTCWPSHSIAYFVIWTQT